MHVRLTVSPWPWRSSPC